MSKYGNKRTVCNQKHYHPSKLESDVCNIIAGDPRLLLLKTQECVYLTKARLLYKPDFTVQNLQTGEVYWVEAKGDERAGNWSRNKRLWKHYGPGRLEVWKSSKHGPRFEKAIVPVVGSIGDEEE